MQHVDVPAIVAHDDFRVTGTVEVGDGRGRVYGIAGAGIPEVASLIVKCPDVIAIRADNHFLVAVAVDVRNGRAGVDRTTGIRGFPALISVGVKGKHTVAVGSHHDRNLAVQHRYGRITFDGGVCGVKLPDFCAVTSFEQVHQSIVAADGHLHVPVFIEVAHRGGTVEIIGTGGGREIP